MAVTVDPHVARLWIERVRAGERQRVEDELAVEEPLEIRVDGEPLAVTMRTPGRDEELALGFLAGEGLIAGGGDVLHVGPPRDFAGNTVEVRTRRGLRREPGQRKFFTSSSCGVCGKGALDSVRVEAGEPPETLAVDRRLVIDAPSRARAEQAAFDRTGGLHATALFDARTGSFLVLREDVGRHNAMDKAIGSRILLDVGAAGSAGSHFPLPGVIACLSGRASFELIQKAALARLAGVIAVGAPSTLAVELAREREMLLCGFVRNDSFNVYSGTLHM